jgi:predicted enzyme related to lactoylglutathione lyase
MSPHASGASTTSSPSRSPPDRVAHPGPARPPGEVILDFMVRDADAEYRRIEALGVDWVLRPATQPWGSRSMVFKDPGGNLVNVFSPP